MSSPSHPSQVLELLDKVKTVLQSQHELPPTIRASIVAELTNLRDTAETPLQSILRIFMQPVQNAALRVAVELGLLSILAKNPTSALHLSEMAAKPRDHSGAAANATEKGSSFKGNHAQPSAIGDPELIVRLMRVLTAMSICDEVGFQTYKANPLTEALAQEGLSSGVKFVFDCGMPSLAKVVEFLKSNNFENPADSIRSPFAFAFGAPKFEWFKSNPESSAHFDSFMSGRRMGIQGGWMDLYPIEANLIEGMRQGDQTAFCVDIGGGKGHDLKLLHEKFPSTGRLVLQDQEAVVGSSTVFESMAHDFFQPQPIKGARMYHMRAILHDWPTVDCRNILSHIAEAMEPGYSRLIIRDHILPDTDAPLGASCNDLFMMVLFAGVERTVSQWKDLLGSVDLEVVGMWNLANASTVGEGIIEAVKSTRVS